MTAEIGVMNRVGVALAADSAVTVGGDSRKVFSSADKLFQMSYNAPVGAMIYGSATYLDIPWETLIKSARSELAAQTFPKLQDYGAFLVSFLSRGAPIFPTENEDAALTRLCLNLMYDIRAEMEGAIDVEASKAKSIDETAVANILSLVVTQRLTTIQSQAYLSGFGAADMADAAAKCEPIVKKIHGAVFGELPLSAVDITSLRNCAAEMAIRNYPGPSVSGLVVAGFGDGEYLPMIVRYEIEERVLGRPRICTVSEHGLSSSTSARIVPFAQHESVAAFLEGVEPQIQNEMQDSVSVLFKGALATMLDRVREDNAELATALDAQMSSGLDDMLKRLFAGWRLMRTNFWRPVVDMVAALPKDELAGVAESLVNLTKFRRRITPVHESVGGPIDVAMISKGDGFVWVKRKHYFPAELNPRAIARIQSGIGK